MNKSNNFYFRVLKKIFIVILLAWLIVPTTSTQAQSTPINYAGWYGYDAYPPFQDGKPWGLWVEAYWIRQDVITKKNAAFVLLGLNYYLKSGNRITGSLAYQYNYPYDEGSKPYNWPDYRLFQQYLIRVPKAKGMWQFRFRIEERWLGRKNDPTSNTFDYNKYETSIIPMVKKSFVLSEKFYASVCQEFWLLFTTTDRLLDQSRTYAGLGMNLDKEKEWHVELGYMYYT